MAEEEKIPIEVFAEFFKYWKELWKTMMEPKLSSFYFKKDRDICLIAGMMRKQRARRIISKFSKGTFLIRFSKRDAASLVLVVSSGIDKQPKEYKIRIIKDHSNELLFEYDTVKRGVQNGDTLGQVIKEIHCVEHLWYQKRGKVDGDKRDKGVPGCVERDKRKVLKLFRDAKDSLFF